MRRKELTPGEKNGRGKEEVGDKNYYFLFFTQNYVKLNSKQLL